jgi:hypothetical protein
MMMLVKKMAMQSPRTATCHHFDFHQGVPRVAAAMALALTACR